MSSIARQFFNFQQSTSQDTLEAKKHLLILMEEADVDCMGQEDILCMMLLNCLLDMALKAKLGVVKTPTSTTFNEIFESHKTGKKAANMTVSANAIKSKEDKGRNPR